MQMRYLKNVTTLRLDPEACTGCGMCEKVCPRGVFTLESGRAQVADPDACIECGACASNCPADAISVNSGVGCAIGVMIGAMRGTEPTCDCGEGECC